MKILTIDDSVTVREVIRNAVEVLGYECIEAENGVVGLEAVSKNSKEIALILLDWNMPIMDGFAFLKTIKASSEHNHIPVTMVTSENEMSKIISAVGEGAKNYIIKPFTQDEIMKKILESLGVA
jgi:two-component system, chemotaxis family, chemotaxis protein CheY